MKDGIFTEFKCAAISTSQTQATVKHLSLISPTYYLRKLAFFIGNSVTTNSLEGDYLHEII